MTKLIAALLCLGLLLSVFFAVPADAVDEDTQASVYLVFDPETGDFVTVDDPSVTAQHAAQQEQEAIEEGTMAAGEGSPETARAPERPSMLLVGLVVAALIFAGFVWLRRGRQKTA